MTTIVARRLPDGNLVEVLPDGTTRHMSDTTDWAVAAALTDEEITAAALADPDAQPLPEGWIDRAARGPHPLLVRKRLRLTREEFATRYHIPMDVIIAWEQRTLSPDDIARAYMKVIMADPVGVAKAVGPNTTPDHPRAAE